MQKMNAKKINKKACMNCGLEAAVARKVCSGCNTPFYKRPSYVYETKEVKDPSAQKADPSSNYAQSQSNPQEDNNRRRTERVKREKPRFYDASEFENKTKKKKNDKNNVKTSTKTNKATAAQIKKKERKRLKELKLRESLAEAEDENLYESIMTPCKAELLSIVLDELNNKVCICSWKP